MSDHQERFHLLGEPSCRSSHQGEDPILGCKSDRQERFRLSGSLYVGLAVRMRTQYRLLEWPSEAFSSFRRAFV